MAALVAQEDTCCKAFIGWNGMYDFVNDGDGRFGHGNSYGQETPSAEKNSAIYNIRNLPPQTLLMHGDNDDVISYKQSEYFHNAIVNVGGKSNLIIYKEQPHWLFYAPGGKYEVSSVFLAKRFLKEAFTLNKE